MVVISFCRLSTYFRNLRRRRSHFRHLLCGFPDVPIDHEQLAGFIGWPRLQSFQRVRL